MERRTFAKAQIYVRESYNRALKCASSGAFHEAVRILVPVAKLNPEVPMLFEKLRAYEIEICKQQNPLVKVVWFFLGLFIMPAVRIVALIDPVKAMSMCEGPLAMCVDNPPLISALAAAAESCEAPWISATALNVLCTFHPGSEGNQRRLAAAMQENGQAQAALKIFREIAKRHPGDLAVQAELREAMALASIERGKWEEDGATQNKAADAEDAVLQQLLEGTIHDAEQAEILIRKFNADLRDNDSIDMRRKLADAYMVAEKYEEALREYRIVAEKLGAPDPLLDKQIEKAYIAGLTQSLTELQTNPQSYENPEEQIASISQEIHNYKRRHAIQRARMFPNDMQMQFDLGVFYFEAEEYDNALGIFKTLAKVAQKQRDALIYLGRCQLLKEDVPGAVASLEKAISLMYRTDRYKREALYFLGEAYTLSGQTEKAIECYQLIYASIPDYRDVAAKITALGAVPGVIESADQKKDDDE